ncbi:GroES-like protein [Dichomitus squalens]|uniref:GroES-like protein n=1 Tax=Dichomitus squalens TaxID=114155 RepID=A0A4Q9MLI8_9APHY|nr:GroES-like protein [Dichomitus squalens LYAD-421 SS1]EJF63732.1 GroES-like protein [Dichomitus squalens LYAD-421 SS1]TBU28490.1 GroES-like protein [Dichomitus squalens]TBU48932.1 GroES-like protein [Dichomitus squalens]TBU59303.1 GroES-like protein [Dichomitus squalens]
MPGLVEFPATYTAYAFLVPGGKLQKITVPWKFPKAGEIVVKVLACGVCGTDDICPTQVMPVPLPRVPGHEIVGDVVAVSCQETMWKVGQRVGAGYHGGHCYTCVRCRAGDYMTCQNQCIIGANWDGGYAEYVTLRSEAVVKVPEDMDPAEAAPLLCAGISTFNALRNMSISPPEYVAIQGIGGLGHLAVQFASAMGFRTIALSSDGSKEELARTLGADEFIDSSKVDQAQALQEFGGMKVIMSTAPNANVTESLIDGLAVNGTLLVLAVEPEPMKISPLSLLVKRLSIRGWPAGSPKDAEDCLAFVQAKKLKCLVERFPLHKAHEAYAHRETARFRAVIIP